MVVGGGVAGLAVAIRLQVAGYQVDIFEANTYSGGKLSELAAAGYRFDAGPSLLTMPQLVDDLFRIAGKPAGRFAYRKLDEVCRYFFADGTRFTMPGDHGGQVDALSQNLDEEPGAIEKYLNRSALKYNTIGRLFLERSLRKPSTFLNRQALKAYLKITKLGLTETLHACNRKAFRNPKTVQLFDRYATYNGSNPYQTPAVMSLIPHLELGMGAIFPVGGMVQIVRSLEDLARSLGVVFHLGKPVTGILLNQKGEARAIEFGGKVVEGAIVISAVDVSLTYSKLLRRPDLGLRYARLPKSTSAIIFYWGIRKSFPVLGLHNLFFSADYKKEFDALFQDKVLPNDPSIYLNISAKENATDAPPGCENWFVMVNAPANEGQPWHEWIPGLRQKLLTRLSLELGQPIEPLIETEMMLDPRLLESRTGAVGGALYGTNSNSRFAAFIRHANVCNAIPHLYFCGGTVHPGGGIPLALQSAAIAARYVAEREAPPGF